eukprot:TRINITY_DN1443_c0_g1_i2.p1 TRINITY_DN1443_c0_g1~~TRINITY_DN1443_c0_g1_i2.p1  ORF type:complete len:1061 (-),score=156.00 TRINITY_DN1443_c0_g1_i2:321-3503(-)
MNLDTSDVDQKSTPEDPIQRRLFGYGGNMYDRRRRRFEGALPEGPSSQCDSPCVGTAEGTCLGDSSSPVNVSCCEASQVPLSPSRSLSGSALPLFSSLPSPVSSLRRPTSSPPSSALSLCALQNEAPPKKQRHSKTAFTQSSPSHGSPRQCPSAHEAQELTRRESPSDSPVRETKVRRCQSSKEMGSSAVTPRSKKLGPKSTSTAKIENKIISNAITSVSAQTSPSQNHSTKHFASILRSLQKKEQSVTSFDYPALFLPGTHLSEAKMERLLQAIRQHPGIRFINLRHFPVSTTIMEAVCRCIEESAGLRELDLSYTDLCPQSINKLARILFSNRTMKTLSLDGVNIGRNECVLSRALVVNTTLTELYLRNCKLSETNTWIVCISRNSTLTTLVTEGNEPDFDVKAKLKYLVITNRVLTSLKQKGLTRPNFIKYVHSYHASLLSHSVSTQHLAVISYLLTEGVRVLPEDSLGTLQNAINNNDVEMIKLLIAGGAVVCPEIIAYAQNREAKECLKVLKQAELDVIDISDHCFRWCQSITYPINLTSLILSTNGIKSLDASFFLLLASYPRLTHLDLSENKISELPIEISSLSQLKHLDLSRNNLNSLPPGIASLRNLKTLNIRHTPLGQIVPEEIQKKGIKQVLQYHKDWKEPSKSWSTLKLLVLGQEGVGKTSIIRSLQKKSKEETPTQEEGITIQNWKSPKGINFLIYDFAGHEVFYPTHQLFLNDKAIYVIVFKLPGLNEGRVEYWLKRIKLMKRKNGAFPPVITVGTHLDHFEVTKSYLNFIENRVGKWKKKIYPNIVEHVNVSCTSNKGMKQLREKIIQVAGGHRLINSLVPQAYLSLAHFIHELKSKYTVMSWKTYASLAFKDASMGGEMIKEATRFMHEAGLLLWFDRSGVSDMVILHQNWIAEIFSQLVNQTNGCTNAIVSEKKLKTMWQDIDCNIKKSVINCLLSFEIMIPLKGSHFNSVIVPSLLPETPTEISEKTIDMTKLYKIERTYQFNYLPVGLFPRLVSRMFQVPSLYCYGASRNGFLMVSKALLTNFGVKNERVTATTSTSSWSM